MGDTTNLGQFNKAIAAVIGSSLMLASLIFKQDLGAYADLIAVSVTTIMPLVIFMVPNIAPYVEDGGKGAAIEDLAAHISDVVKDNINASHAAQLATIAKNSAEGALSVPGAVVAPDGMQRP